VTTEVTEPPDAAGKGGRGTVVVRATSGILHVVGGAKPPGSAC
jgi:hypothetical protein